MLAQIKYNSVFVTLAFMLTANAVQATEPLLLDKAIGNALATNPSLAAIEARAKALGDPTQLDTLPDPVLSINIANLPLENLSFDQEGMTQLQIGISQSLPYPGKLALRAEIAQQVATAATADVEEKRLQLVRDVKSVWWNLYYLDRALEVIARNQILLGQFVNVAETRYIVGRGLQQDILLAQLELSKLSDSTLSALNWRENEVIRLNVLMDQPITNPIVLPAVVDESLSRLNQPEVLLKLADVTRATLVGQTELVGAAHSRVELAKKEVLPNFNVGAMYGLRGGNRADFGSIKFSANLPLYTGSKLASAVDQRNAEWMQQKYHLQDQRQRVASDVFRAVTDYGRAVERTQLFQQEIIPQARQTVDAMLAGYQVGKVDFLNLVRSQTTLYNYETQYWKALSMANQALARLTAAVGEENLYE